MFNLENTFPDTYENTPLEALLMAYNKGPDRIKKCVEGLTGKELKEKVNAWMYISILVQDMTNTGQLAPINTREFLLDAFNIPDKDIANCRNSNP